MVEQVRAVRRTLAEEAPANARPKLHGVLFQGMGEPLANLDRVLDAIAVMSEPSALAIDARNITVCTAGLPRGIRRLAREAPKVRLGLSVHAAHSAVRRALMPIEARHPLDEVLEACREHARLTGIAPMWAVTLIAGVNDRDADAQALAALMADFTEQSGVRPRLSLLRYNRAPHGDDPYEPASPERERAFGDVVKEAGLPVHRRYSGGGDIGAACGQLVGRAEK